MLFHGNFVSIISTYVYVYTRVIIEDVFQTMVVVRKKEIEKHWCTELVSQQIYPKSMENQWVKSSALGLGSLFPLKQNTDYN